MGIRRRRQLKHQYNSKQTLGQKDTAMPGCLSKCLRFEVDRPIVVGILGKRDSTVTYRLKIYATGKKCFTKHLLTCRLAGHRQFDERVDVAPDHPYERDVVFVPEDTFDSAHFDGKVHFQLGDETHTEQTMMGRFITKELTPSPIRLLILGKYGTGKTNLFREFATTLACEVAPQAYFEVTESRDHGTRALHYFDVSRIFGLDTRFVLVDTVGGDRCKIRYTEPLLRKILSGEMPEGWSPLYTNEQNQRLVELSAVSNADRAINAVMIAFTAFSVFFVGRMDDPGLHQFVEALSMPCILEHHRIVVLTKVDEWLEKAKEYATPEDWRRAWEQEQASEHKVPRAPPAQEDEQDEISSITSLSSDATSHSTLPSETTANTTRKTETQTEEERDALFCRFLEKYAAERLKVDPADIFVKNKPRNALHRNDVSAHAPKLDRENFQLLFVAADKGRKRIQRVNDATQQQKTMRQQRRNVVVAVKHGGARVWSSMQGILGTQVSLLGILVVFFGLLVVGVFLMAVVVQRGWNKGAGWDA
eukprot:TRINITY_DN112578_c0_g1_i1.p1 TRINITY_DN112578_c0_g1~~TRINITY_DN112578_c0_g1_i1.p1  ORF type:complete len:533 (+),score=-0.40 TRINITY_DN112578_c0_g1_i1:49-1647(+)